MRLHSRIVELRFVTERKKKKNEAEFIPRVFPLESPSEKTGT